MKRTTLITAVALAVTTAGCGIKDDFNDARGRGDAGIGHVDNTAKDVIEMPDRFGNVATACDGHGHRIFVTTRGDGRPGNIAVIDDPSCGNPG